MRCKKCGFCVKECNKGKCWRKWQLCGACGVKTYPEEYHIRVIKRVAKNNGWTQFNR